MSRPSGAAHGWDMEQCIPGVCHYEDRSSELYCIGALPKLVTEREQLLEAALKAVEFGRGRSGLCGECLRSRHEGHTPDCIVGKALK